MRLLTVIGVLSMLLWGGLAYLATGNIWLSALIGLAYADTRVLSTRVDKLVGKS